MTDTFQPSSGREVFEVTMCYGKQSFDNGTLAHRRLREMGNKTKRAFKGKGARVVYRCSVCRKWHIGSAQR